MTKTRIDIVVSIEPEYRTWFKEHHMNISSFVRGKMKEYIDWFEARNK